MDERPEVPDPQHDRHVAFPNEAATPPPESWWTPNPPPPPPPPVVWRTSAPRRRPRRSAAWWAVVAVFLFGGLLSRGGESSGSSGFGGGTWAEAPGPGSVSLVAEGSAPSGAIEAVQPTLYGIPPGSSTFRVEVVGVESSAGIDITSEYGGPLLTNTEKLPYAGRLTRSNPDEAVTVSILSTHSDRTVQCRVYLDDQLVAFSTGDGNATCEVPASR